jgi:hypothetical protein
LHSDCLSNNCQEQRCCKNGPTSTGDSCKACTSSGACVPTCGADNAWCQGECTKYNYGKKLYISPTTLRWSDSVSGNDYTITYADCYCQNGKILAGKNCYIHSDDKYHWVKGAWDKTCTLDGKFCHDTEKGKLTRTVACYAFDSETANIQACLDKEAKPNTEKECSLTKCIKDEIYVGFKLKQSLQFNGLTKSDILDNKGLIENALADYLEVSSDDVKIVSVTESENRRRLNLNGKLNRKLVEAKTVKVDYEVKYRGKDSSSVTNSMGAPGYKRVIINRVVTITGISDITLEISEVETKKIGKHSNTNNGDNMTSAWSNEDRLDVATKNLPAIYTSVVFVLPILMTLATILFY